MTQYDLCPKLNYTLLWRECEPDERYIVAPRITMVNISIFSKRANHIYYEEIDGRTGPHSPESEPYLMQKSYRI